MSEQQLSVQTGFASLQGRRDDNQDFGGFTLPGGKDLALRGLVVAVADGVGGMKGGAWQRKPVCACSWLVFTACRKLWGASNWRQDV